MPAASLTLTGPLMFSTGMLGSTIVPVPTKGLVFCGVAAPRVKVSVGSEMPSFTVGRRTMKLLAPGGTVTDVPVTGVKVKPPSNETNAGLVSVPKVAVPDAGLRVTVVGVVLVLLNLTTKSSGEPSLTPGLLIPDTFGRSSSAGVPGSAPVPVPSSRTSVETVPVAITALTGALKFNVKRSDPSNTASFVIATVIVLVVSPGAKVKVPSVDVKSLPATAVPLDVL